MIAAIRSPAWPSHSGGPSAGTSRPSASTDRGSRHDRLGLDQAVGAVGDRDRPLGVGPHRQARDAQHGRLLLDPARVGDDQGRAADQRQEVHVAQRIDDPQPVAGHSPAASSVGRPRGWSGTTSVTSSLTPRSIADDPRRLGRARRRWPAGASSRPRTAPGSASAERIRAASNRSRFASSVSIIGLPTRWIRPRGTPSRTRLSMPSGRRHEQEVARAGP